MFTNLNLIPDSSSENGSPENNSIASNSDTSTDELTEFLVDSNAKFTEIVTNYYYYSSDDDDDIQEQVKKRQSRKEKGVVFYTDEDGIRRVLPSTMSLWYNSYVRHPHLDCKRFHNKFRRRFRMPYGQYVDLVGMVKESNLFDRWREGNRDAVGNPAAPIELLVLTALRYLGRGWTFDDLSESTAISEDVIRVFFHKFIEFGSTTLFNRFVIVPSTVEEAQKQSHEYEVAGLPGAIGSMDSTHVLHERVQYGMRQSHLGFKLNGTARTYNLVVNHRRRILGTTDGHPARWNDKTIVRFDKIAMGLKNGTILSDFIFELYDYNSSGEIIKVKYRGPWLLVDNGYHRWSTSIPPFKATISRKEIRFSEWLESMRKDVECTFGILKGRWRILKSGIRLNGLNEADMVWKTCCSLHNWLLEVDGLDEQWSKGNESQWQGDMGLHDDDDIERIRSVERLHNPGEARNFDSSGMGYGSDFMEDDNDTDENSIMEQSAELLVVDNDGALSVQHLSFHYFRSKLVNHFDIAFKKREVKWPNRNQTKERNV